MRGGDREKVTEDEFPMNSPPLIHLKSPPGGVRAGEGIWEGLFGGWEILIGAGRGFGWGGGDFGSRH